MRCPKCGYNSFDHLDSCKKCGKDLVEFKQSFGIKSVLFPGRVSAGADVGEVAIESTAADAAVAAVTGVAAAAATTATAVSAVADEPVTAGTDGDDFGFDFMGDSTDDDDLSFDELFEEAPEDEDIEETIEAPKEEAEAGDDSSFDLPDEDAELEDDFGFDPVDEDSDPDDDFSFDDDEPKLAEDSGTEEGPERPFDLPESPQTVGAPEEEYVEQVSIPADIGETGDLFATDTDIVDPDSLAETSAPEPTEPVLLTPEPVEKEEPVTVAASAPAVQTVTTATVGAVAVATVPVPEKDADSVSVFPPSVGNCIGAFVCDLILLAIVGTSFVVAAEAAISTKETRLLPSLETLIDLSVPYFLVLFFLAFGYFTLFHFLAGQTPGKMLTRLRVETTEGEPLTFAQAFLRSVGGLLQLLPAGLGYLLILISPERRGWNDRLAGTRVVALRDSV